MLERAIEAISRNQNSDGGWGSVRGKQSNTEATSFAVLALDSSKSKSAAAKIKRGLAWLLRHRNDDGSWRLSDASNEGSWTTTLAVIALSRYPEHQSAILAAANWVLERKGSKPGILANLIQAFTFKRNTAQLNPNLVGWSWVPKTFSWVEPTSYALMALKKAKPLLSASNLDERIQQGELMIYDRMCHGGGWNYGNAKVLGEALWPYPDLTAIALIALQNHALTEPNRESVQALECMMNETNSGLALSWGTICLSLYRKNVSEWQARIERCFDATGFLGETKPIALSILALIEDRKAFEFPHRA
jgi:hypothetical protein